MDSLNVVITIIVDEIEVDDAKLKKAVLAARSEMCKKLNNGWIEQYNALTREIEVDDVNIYGYQKAYEILTNSYWTQLLHKKTKKYNSLRIVDETLVPLTLGTYDCRIRLVNE